MEDLKMFNFGKKNKERSIIQSKDVDFDSLVEKVKSMDEREGQTLLWGEAYKLTKWHLITKVNSNINETNPFIGELEGKGWFYIFTDSIHANHFATEQGLIDENGLARTIAMEPVAAAEWITKHLELGIFGVRFNEGEHGWFAPISNLMPIYKYLRELNAI